MLVDERVRAHALFVYEGKSATHIASILDIHINTVYGWIKAENWTKQREDRLISTVGIREAFREALLALLQEINEKKVSGAFVSDALYKRALDYQRALRELDGSYDKRSMALAIFAEFTQHMAGQNDIEAVNALKAHINAFLSTIQ